MSRRSARASAADLPRVPRTFDLQAESRRLLEAALAPWLVTRWDQNDFGFDAVVEITDPVTGTGDREVTGRLFGVQLKATDAETAPTSLPVSTGHLRYWLQHSLPMLLVSAHIPSGRMMSRWIDDSLRLELRDRSPTFWSQDGVTVPLSLILDQAAREPIQRAVSNFKGRERRVEPGTFFALRTRVLTAADELERIAKRSGVESAALAVAECRTRMRAAAYLVAVAGPQRVGKSTLVNALLGVSVSPVADYPTTAVPLLFEAGSTASAEVAFADRSTVRVEASADALRPFAAQQDNEANAKDVRLVRVTLPNDMLATGISLVDTPGLHDANELVREVTARALKDADAVLYVLDASLGPKFKLGQAEVEDLRSLRGSKERLIVILNQADGITEEQRGKLFTYVEGQLRKYSIWDDLPVPPHFLSGALALESRVAGSPPPPEFAALEDHIWGHLLRNRATGLYRLVQAVHQLTEASDTVVGMLSERARDGSEAGEIDQARRVCRAARAAVEDEVETWRVERTQDIQAFLDEKKHHWREQLRQELQRARAIEDLPKSQVLAARLGKQLMGDGNDVVAWMRREGDALTQRVSATVGTALQESHNHLGIPRSARVVVPLPRVLPPVDLSLPEAGIGFFAGLLGFLANPGLGIATTIFGWLFGHKIAVKERLGKAVVDIEAGFANTQDERYAEMERQLLERVDAVAHSVAVQATAKLDTFISDASRRVERLGRPLTDEEVREMALLSEEAKTARARFRAIYGDLAPLIELD